MVIKLFGDYVYLRQNMTEATKHFNKGLEFQQQ